MSKIDFCAPPVPACQLDSPSAESVDGGRSPDGGVPAEAPATPTAATNCVDSFNDGPAPRGSIADDSAPPAVDPRAPTIPASMLLYSPRTAWDAAQPTAAPPSAPKSTPSGGAKVPVLPEPISTETTPAKAPADQKPVKLNIGWISQYDPNVELRNTKGEIIPLEWPADVAAKMPKKGSPRDSACAAAGKEMLRRGGAELRGANLDIADAKDKQGRIVPNRERAKQAHDHIDAQLDAGKPILVGVTWNTPVKELNDGNCDHFVVVTGRGVDEQGRAYYTFNDPGAGKNRSDVGSDARAQNRFYVDEATGELYRPGTQRSPAYTTDSRYEVSRVCLNK